MHEPTGYGTRPSATSNEATAGLQPTLERGGASACLQPHGAKLEGARADALFACDGCARHRRPASARLAMVTCMSCS